MSAPTFVLATDVTCLWCGQIVDPTGSCPECDVECPGPDPDAEYAHDLRRGARRAS